MSNNFNPNPDFIRSLQELLLNAASGQGDHRGALNKIQELQGNRDFFDYCAVIMAEERDPSPQKQQTRYLATLQIKNGMMNPNCGRSEIVRDYTLRALEDPGENVQRLVGSIVASAVFRSAWPPEVIGMVLDNLQRALENNGVVGGYIRSIFEVVEQHVELIDLNMSPRVLDLFIPLLQYPNLSKASQKATLETVVILIEQCGVNEGGNAFNFMNNNQARFEQLLNYLGSAVRSQDAHSVQFGIRCLYYLFTFEEKMVPYFQPMADLMLNQLSNIPVEEVKIEVVEFWRAVLRRPKFLEHSLTVMPNVIRIMLNYIVYSKEELQTLLRQGNDWQIQDRPEDVRPKQFQIDRARKNVHKEEDGDNNNNGNNDDDYDEDDDAEVQEWNLRQAAVTALDELAQQFGEKIIDIVMNVIGERMNSGDWKEVDSGVAAIAAISTGCLDFLAPRLEGIIPKLCNMINNPETHFLITSDCLWTLGRYAEFLICHGDRTYLEQSLRSICLLMCNSTSKHVQASAIVALQDIADQAGEGDLDQYAGQIVETVATCFERFKLKNCYLLFECVDVLTSALGNTLADEAIFSKLTKPLSQMWENTPDDSPLIYPLFACMSGICSAVGNMIMPLAETLFNRCIKICEIIGPMRAQALARANGDPDEADLPPDTEEFLVASVDLLSGLFEALGTSIEPLVQKTGPKKVMNIFIYCADEVNNQIRTSAFGALGEMARSCVGFLQPALPDLYPLILKQLNQVHHTGVCSNIAWMISQLLNCQSETAGPTLKPDQFDDIFRPFAFALVDPPEDSRNMQENFCVCMGMMIAIDPEIVGRLQSRHNIMFASYLKPWCDVTRGMHHTGESQRAVGGFLTALYQSPQSATSCVHSVFDVFLSLPKDISLDLRNGITGFMNNLKQGMGQDFGRALGQYKRRKQIYERFNVQ